MLDDYNPIVRSLKILAMGFHNMTTSEIIIRKDCSICKEKLDYFGEIYCIENDKKFKKVFGWCKNHNSRNLTLMEKEEQNEF